MRLFSLGPPEVIEGTIVDITERKEAEEALRLSRERYRSVIESSRDGLFFFDLATRRVLESNPAFQRLLGYSAEELSALTLYDFSHPDRASVDANIHRLADQGRLTIPNRAFRRKDGTEVNVEIDAVLLEEVGAPDRSQRRAQSGRSARAGGAAPAGPEDGGGRTARGRRRSRLQQSPDGRPRLRRAPPRLGSLAGRETQRGRDPKGGRARRRADEAASRLQPQAGAPAEGPRRERGAWRGRQPSCGARSART